VSLAVLALVAIAALDQHGLLRDQAGAVSLMAAMRLFLILIV